MNRSLLICFSAVLIAALTSAAGLSADQHTGGVPTLNSRSGAAYTVYLDFSGFNFSGTWGSSGKSPGVNTSFDNTSGSSNFSAADQTIIRNFWARVANSYSPFSVNVTTVDPAATAGQADTDAHRQAYYDSQAQLMHTVVTTSYAWYGVAGGVSWVGVTPNSYNPASFNGGAGQGWHTNWVFTQGVGSGVAGAQAGAHENGHGFGLSHQSDYSATATNEYSLGDNISAGYPYNGSIAPIMGAAYYTQRGQWRYGTKSSSSSLQNDVQILANLSNMNGYIQDGVGHTRGAATNLPLVGNAVDYNLAKGLIVPASVGGPQPMGIDNYTTDFWRFRSDGVQAINLTVYDGDELLNPGAQDPGVMLRSKLSILDGSGNVVGAGSLSTDTLSETYAGTLGVGDYYARITSFGGYAQTLTNPRDGNYQTTYYFDMGSYFMSGSGFASVPEPATCALLALGALGLARLRRKRAA